MFIHLWHWDLPSSFFVDVVAGTNPSAAIKYSRSAARFSPLDAAPLIQASALAALADQPRDALEFARQGAMVVVNDRPPTRSRPSSTATS